MEPSCPSPDKSLSFFYPPSDFGSFATFTIQSIWLYVTVYLLLLNIFPFHFTDWMFRIRTCGFCAIYYYYTYESIFFFYTLTFIASKTIEIFPFLLSTFFISSRLDGDELSVIWLSVRSELFSFSLHCLRNIVSAVWGCVLFLISLIDFSISVSSSTFSIYGLEKQHSERFLIQTLKCTINIMNSHYHVYTCWLGM